MNKILTILEKKGSIATVIGFLFALPVNTFFTIQFFRNNVMDDAQLKGIIVMNIIGMCWFILPSVIEIKSKLFEITIKD
jgi:hypothetical protein